MTTTAPVPSALSQYASATMVDNFAWWCEEFCVQTTDQFSGLPLILEPWQLEFFAEALAVDEDERPYWRTVGLIVPRKNGKTACIGAYATYHAHQFAELEPEVLLAAASDKQAGRLYKAVSGFIRQAPGLRGDFHLRDYVGQVARVDGLGAIHRMASNPNAADGYNPSLTVVDELHRWATPSLRTFWGALNSAGGARKHSQVFFITTAGEAHHREDGILGSLLDANEAQGDVEQPHDALRISRNHKARTLIYSYAAPTKDRTDFPAIRRANPATFVSDEFLRQQIANPALSDAEFLQLHGCVWAAGEETFIDPDTWRDLGDGGPLDMREPCHLMIDGSYRYDTTAVAWARRSPDGRIDVGCHVFSARHDAPHHTLCPGGKISLGDVEAFVQRSGAQEIIFDPRFMARSAEIIADALPSVPVIEIEPQSAAMYDALAFFHRAVAEGLVRHNGDPVVAAHIAACRGEQVERGWRVTKRTHSRPIDAVIAIAGAVWRAAHSRPRAFVVG